MTELGSNSYGKSGIRVVHVDRSTTPHRIRDLTVAIALAGDFEASYVDGDNNLVVATDTMKNTAYALARDRLDGSIERYGEALARHFFGLDQVVRATADIRELPWRPIMTPNGPSDHAFERPGAEARTAVVSVDGDGVTVEAGIEDLVVLKTTHSAFEGFPRDRYTTLPETTDRMMATQVSARWRYGSSSVADADLDALHASIRTTFLETFAAHDSASVQASTWLVGRAILERHPAVDEIHLVLPNLHHWLADLAPFGQDNPGVVYVATREPYGRIEATIRRSEV